MTFDYFYFFMSIDLLAHVMPHELKKSPVLVLSRTKWHYCKQFLSMIQGLAQARDNYLPIGSLDSASVFWRLGEFNSMDVARHASWPQGQRTGSATI